MSGHGGFSAIGSGMKVPQTFDMPKVEELQLGKDKLGALNVEGHKAEVQVADTRLDQTNRLAANLDAMLLRAAKTASAPVDVKALKDNLAAAGLDKATRKSIEGAAKKAQTSFQAINRFSGRQIDEAFNALAKAETAYAAKGTPLDHSLFESARGVLTDLTNRLNGIRREVTIGSMQATWQRQGQHRVPGRIQGRLDLHLQARGPRPPGA